MAKDKHKMTCTPLYPLQALIQALGHLQSTKVYTVTFLYNQYVPRCYTECNVIYSISWYPLLAKHHHNCMSSMTSHEHISLAMVSRSYLIFKDLYTHKYLYKCRYNI